MSPLALLGVWLASNVIVVAVLAWKPWRGMTYGQRCGSGLRRLAVAGLLLVLALAFVYVGKAKGIAWP